MTIPPICYAATALAVLVVTAVFILSVRRAAGHMTVDEGQAFGGDE